MKVGLAEKVLMKIGWDTFVDMDQVSEKYGKVWSVPSIHSVTPATFVLPL